MRLSNPFRKLVKRDGARHYDRGNALIASGQFAAAVASYDAAVALQPEHARAFCNRGVALERLSRLDEACASYTRAINIDPADALAHFNRAALHRARGRLEQALLDYDRAIQIKPDYAEAYCNRGTLLQALGRADAALESYDRSIAIQADFDQAYFNRGALLQDRRLWNEALTAYDRTIELNPAHGGAHANRGVVLTELRRAEDALLAFDRALALKPDLPEVFANRGRLRAWLGMYDEAIVDFDRAIELRADYAYAFYGRADALGHQQKFAASVASYDRAIALNPGFTVLGGLRRFAQMKVCDWTGLESDVAAFTSGLELGECVSPPLPLLALLASPRLHHLAARAWTRAQCPPDNALGPIPIRSSRNKIRIGYFSADFREHAVAQMTAAVFEAHDRSRFELIAFAFGPAAEDSMRQRLERAFDRLIAVGERSDLEVASLARELEIDTAVDLGGFTAHSRPRIFALRAAPIQINYLGYPGSMGAAYMDYLIADEVVVPTAQQTHYSEKLIRLPETFFPVDPMREIATEQPSREQLGLPATGFVFCCFNNNYKITPEIFATWMRILQRVDGAVIWLSRNNADAAANLRSAASRLGIDPDRIIFADRVPSLALHLARYRAADLFLDTRPYNAHATAVDALTAGLPVLTCIGEGFAGRVAASLLKAIGLPELITESVAAYEDLALGLARDPARLARLKGLVTLHRRTTHLFDVLRYTRHLEAGYVAAYDRLLHRLPPDHIAVVPQDSGPEID